MNNPDSEKIITKLKTYANPANLEGMRRFGIVGKNMLGGPGIPVLRQMAKETKKTEADCHGIALDLWDSGIHEARILASMIEQIELVDEKQMEEWVKDFDSWDICDQTCSNLFGNSRFASEKAIAWSERNEEYIKRAGFALMAVISVHDKKAEDGAFEPFLDQIIKKCTDERNFVKKAVNWALRQIGKRNEYLRKRAIETAIKIKAIDSKSSRWIAADALRELNK